MKYTKILAIVFVIVAFAIFFISQPVREKACPLTTSETAPTVQNCADLNGIVKNGQCVCRD
jgi:large-conductance mechanosensitive channel